MGSKMTDLEKFKSGQHLLYDAKYLGSTDVTDSDEIPQEVTKIKL